MDSVVTRHRGSGCGVALANLALAWLVLWAAASLAHAGQSLFWLQEDADTSGLGTVTNPVISVAKGVSTPLYLWLDKDSVSYGFDGISLDVRLTSSDGGGATVGLQFDEPPGRWHGTTGGGVRIDSGGNGVDDSNAIDLTNTDTLSIDPLRLAVLDVTGASAGTVRVHLCVGGLGIVDGGNNAVVWFGFANNSTGPDTQLISGGVAGLCSSTPEATILVTSPYLGDFDGDDDVDQEDFSYLQRCLAGSILPQTDPACADANLDGDPYVDQNDVLAFQQCYSGPNIPPPVGCQSL